MTTIEYDYRTMRKNSFVICNNQLYEGYSHFDCLINAIQNNLGNENWDNRYDEYVNMSEGELSRLLGEVIMGEIAKVEGGEGLVCYNESHLPMIKKYYNNFLIYNHSKGYLNRVA